MTQPVSVLIIVTDLSALSSEEEAIKSRLEGLGHTVTCGETDMDRESFDLVVIAEQPDYQDPGVRFTKARP